MSISIPVWMLFIILYIIVSIILSRAASKETGYFGGIGQMLIWVFCTGVFLSGFVVWTVMKFWK